ncbi:MAG: VWA domain-containing protein [Kangiellaceae bacterium]|nr:VWA domain-containing protein [Kangiellaceae bacterium]
MNSTIFLNPTKAISTLSIQALIRSSMLALLLSFSLVNFCSAAAAEKSKADVRLLIDISGSMKKNDPKNLRIPALQLVTNLLPKGADAGVWAFGKQVNMMVPLATVDSAWQIKATNIANKINSRGLFTNIGNVLEKASYGWIRPSKTEKRSFVLLTDGMVDISKDPAVNAKERKRILEVVLPKLKKAGVAIHTIALSQNADHELLKQLSTQTDGWYQAVDNAEELQRVFLKIFEQAAQRDNLPIKDNLFSVDKSIDEMTVLIFKKDTNDANLISPSGKYYNNQLSSPALRWFSTDGYDLVTIQKPETGKWKIDANVDPDNRVMVVSKLGMSISELPNNLLAGEAIAYEMKLLEDGKVIDNSDFLSLVDAKLVQNKDGQESTLAMFFDSGNHAFKQSFFTDSFEGELKLQLQVTSPTFERERSHAINIYGSPLMVKVVISDDNKSPHEIQLTVRDDIVDPVSLEVSAVISSPNQEKQFVSLKDLSNPLELPADMAGGDYEIKLKISGKSILGRAFSVSPAAIKFSGKSLEQELKGTPPATEKVILEGKKEEAKEPVEKEVVPQEAPTEEITEPTVESEAEPESEINWVYVGIGANVLLAIVGFFVWRTIKKRNSKAASSMGDELGLGDDDDDESEETANKATVEETENQDEPEPEPGVPDEVKEGVENDAANKEDEQTEKK